MQVRRRLVSEDAEQDRPLRRDAINGDMRAILAFGPTDAFEYHGPNRHGTKLRLFGAAPETADQMSDLVADPSIHEVRVPPPNIEWRCYMVSMGGNVPGGGALSLQVHVAWAGPAGSSAITVFAVLCLVELYY